MPIVVIARSSVLGPLSSWIDQFADDLAAQRYMPLTSYTAPARHFAAWLGCAGISIDLIHDDVVRRFAEHRCRCPGRRSGCISHQNIRAAPGGSLFSCKRQVPHVPLEGRVAISPA